MRLAAATEQLAVCLPTTLRPLHGASTLDSVDPHRRHRNLSASTGKSGRWLCMLRMLPRSTTARRAAGASQEYACLQAIALHYHCHHLESSFGKCTRRSPLEPAFQADLTCCSVHLAKRGLSTVIGSKQFGCCISLCHMISKLSFSGEYKKCSGLRVPASARNRCRCRQRC